MRRLASLLFVTAAACVSIPAEDCERRCGTAQERADLAKACENLAEEDQGNCRAGIVGAGWLCRQFCESGATPSEPDE